MSDKKRRRSIDLSAADHLHVNKKLKNKKSDFESQLEDIVFGTTSTILTSNQVDDLNNEGEDESNNELIRTDNNNKKSGKSSNKNKGKVQKKQILFEENSEESEDSDNKIDELDDGKDLVPAWEDDTLDNVSVNISNRLLKKFRQTSDQIEMDATTLQDNLRKKHIELIKEIPDWAAQYEKESSQEKINDLLKSTKPMIESRITSALAPHELKFQRIRFHPSIKVGILFKPTQIIQGSVLSLQFHPSGEILSAATNNRISLFESNGSILNYSFIPSGQEIISATTNGKLYSINLVTSQRQKITYFKSSLYSCGDFTNFSVSPDGNLICVVDDKKHILLLDGKTKQVVGEFNSPNSIYTLTWSPQSNLLYSAGHGGLLYIWDINTRRCLSKFRDHGITHTKSMSISKDGHYLATGSDSGITNLWKYPEGSNIKSIPTFTKDFSNLVTSISSTVFNPTSEILAISSQYKRNAMRLIHVQSGTVFQNFPMKLNNVGKVRTMTFSPDGSQFFWGTENGNITGIRLRHYHQVTE